MIDAAPHDLEPVLDRIRTALAILTSDMRLEWGNGAFFRRFVEARLGAPLNEAPGPWNLPGVTRLLDDAIKGGIEFDQLEVAGDEQAGTRPSLWLTARSLPLRPGDGRLLLVIDDTSQLATDRSARERERWLAPQDMAAEIAHEFNNLLVGVLGHASFAEEYLEADSKASQSLQRIQAAARRAVELTNRLLLYSGRASRRMEVIDLRRALEATTGQSRRWLPAHVSLEEEFAPDLACLVADPHLLHEIVTGILKNAVESIGERRGSVRIRADHVRADRAWLAGAHVNDDLPEGDYVRIEISDTGPGMDRETLARACDPFFSTRFSGRGLGLAAVAGCVRALCGALFISSQPGRGASFQVLLPRSVAPLDPEPIARHPPPLAPGAPVLVIEHDPCVIDLARSALESLGVRVVATRHAGEGAAIFRASPQRFQAVLLDLTMPDTSGERVLHELRRVRPDVAVVLSSGFGGRGARATISEHASFLKKPYTPGQLIDRLSEAVAHANELASGPR